ncbi:hypothetical protein ALP64_201938 [Pseudomonas syringae pv. actinidiae]|nr:hypothetical protein ALP64_201938 [Pseudomonas syringae pv. actinidiae]
MFTAQISFRNCRVWLYAIDLRGLCLSPDKLIPYVSVSDRAAVGPLVAGPGAQLRQNCPTIIDGANCVVSGPSSREVSEVTAFI